MNWYKKANDRYDHIPEENKGGNCFDDAFEYIFQEGIIRGNNNLKLVHAIICPMMGPLSGVEFGHAWVEDGDKVIDTSRNNEIMDKQTYYMLGGLLNFPTSDDVKSGQVGLTVKEDRIHRYSIEEAKRMAVDHGMYGPWNENMDDFVLDNDEEESGDNKY
jgi:hypothetical protein